MQRHKKLKARILSLALSAAMVLSLMPATVFATEGGNVPLGTSSIGTIQSFEKLENRFQPSTGEGASKDVYALNVELDTLEEDLRLPDELTAMVARTVTVPAEDEVATDDTAADDAESGNQPASPSDAKEEVKEEIKDEDVPLAPEPEQDKETVVTPIESESIPVEWNSDKEYKSDENGKFVYTAVLPEGYILADGVKQPQIYVYVGKQARAGSVTSPLDFTSGGDTSGDGYAWISSTKTLTLTGLNLVTSDAVALKLPTGTTVNIMGNSTVSNTGASISSGNCYAIQTAGDVTFTGSATLTVTSGTVTATNAQTFGVHSAGNLNVTGGRLVVTGGDVANTKDQSYGVYAEDSISVTGGSLSSTGGATNGTSHRSYGGYAKNNIAVSNDAILTCVGGAGINGSSHGVWTNSGSLSVSDTATLTLTGGAAPTSYAASIETDITVSGGSLTSTCDDASEYNCSVYAANITVSGGSLSGIAGSVTDTSNGESYGVQCDAITVSGTGFASGKGTTAAFDASSSITATGMSVTGASEAFTSGTTKTLTQSASDTPVTIGTAVAATAVTFSTLTANGTANTTDTTELTLTFDKDVTGLAADDITVTGATKGTLTKQSGTGVYKLAISNITVAEGANVNVAVAKTGFTFTPTNKDVAVHKVANSSTITPTTAAFDKYASAAGYADVVVTQTLNGNTLTAIKNGATTLTANTHYTVVGNAVTIKKEYLAAQAVGTTTLTFDYSAGTDPTLAITVSDSTPGSAKTLSSIAVTTAPTKTTYTEGESFDKAGMIITANYSDGTSNAVANYTVTPAGALAPSNTKVTVSYTESNVTKTADVSIIVNAAPSGHTHVWTDTWSKDDTNHWKSCTGTGTCPDGNKKDVSAHNFSGNTCSVCGYVKSTAPSVIEKPSGAWTKGSSTGLKFKSDAPYDEFIRVEVNGKEISADKYTISKGSIIVELKTSYLETLSAGTYTLGIVSKGGTATASFEIKAAGTSSDKPSSPQTGDSNGMVPWSLVMLISGLCLLVTALCKKRKTMW